LAVNLFKGKKAVFYTILSIMFVSFAVFIVTQKTEDYRYIDEMSRIQARVYSMDDFLDDIEDDIQRELYITGYRSVSSLVDYIINYGEFIDDVDLRFEEAFMNGTVKNQTIVLMVNNTFPDWLERVADQGEKMGVLLNMSISNIQLYHVSPWSVNISADFVVNITDMSNTAKWNRTAYVVSTIDIYGFEDPLYIINSLGRVTNFINNTVFEGNYTSGSGASFDPSNLLNHTLEGYYATHTDAPSFLMRFENNLNASVYGIESMVDLPELQGQGLDTYDKCVLDYIYWSSSSPTSYQVNNMPSWFRIDAGHTTKYQVDGETY